MAGRWHISYTMPGGQRVTADHRDPVVMVFRRVQAAGHPDPSDLAAILAWYQVHAIESANCAQGACDHHVV